MFTCAPPPAISAGILLCGAILALANNAAAASSSNNPYLNKIHPYGYQSVNSAGNDIAASIVQSDQDDQGFFATGSTTGMVYSDAFADKNIFHAGVHCYLMQIKPFGEDTIWTKKFGALRLGRPTTTKCTSVKVLPSQEGDEHTKIVVLGYTEGDVLFNPHMGNIEFSEVEHENDSKASLNRVNGFAMMLTVPRFEELSHANEAKADEVHVIGGRMLNMEKVTYPISATVVDNKDVIVVSQVSDDPEVNRDAGVRNAIGEAQDIEADFMYGANFKVKVERLSFDPLTGEVHKKWSERFSTDDDSGATATSIVYDKIQNTVTISGTTKGQGDAFGRMDPSRSQGNDKDGYIFTIDADTGALSRDMNLRILTVPGRDEIVSGICKKISGDSLYIVGSTNAILENGFEPAYDVELGDRKFNAFLRKINLSNMKPIWTRQLGPMNIRGNRILDDQDVFGMGCAVDELESRVYLTGTVSAGGTVAPNRLPKGKQDIFVAAFQSTHGTPIATFPTRQIGSVMDEYVAKDGGGITTDEFGNAVLFGTTKGDFIQEKTSKTADFEPTFADVFVMSFLVSDSEHVSIIGSIESDATGGDVSKALDPNTTTKSKFGIAEVVAFSFIGVVVAMILTLVSYKYIKLQRRYSKYSEPSAAGATPNSRSIAIGADSDHAAPARVPGEQAVSAMSYEEMMESYESITAGEDKALVE